MTNIIRRAILDAEIRESFPDELERKYLEKGGQPMARKALFLVASTVVFGFLGKGIVLVQGIEPSWYWAIVNGGVMTLVACVLWALAKRI